ncbi:MAG: hypothetical protein RJB62_537 [Pseudomonadota bacterium]|jgi:protein tyrosine/serine phosphatase
MAALLDRLYNLHWVTPDVARSAQPYIGFYPQFLKAHGFRGLVNLRGENASRYWWRQETRSAAALGITHFDVRLSSRMLPARGSLVALTEALELAPKPFLVKCSGGQDRSSFAAATYLLLQGGLNARAAAEEQFSFWPFLHRPRAEQKWMQHFPAFVCETSKGTSISTWLKEIYAPEIFAEWLQLNCMGKSFVALQKV